MSREEWFKGLIHEFRVQYSNLSKDEKKHISNLDDLTKPCQILSITFDRPPMTKTFILHLPDVGDGTVWEYGPMQPYEAFDIFEEIIANPAWDAPLGKGDRRTIDGWDEPIVRTVLDSDLFWILRDIQRRVMSPPPDLKGLGEKTYFLERSAVWTCNGDITQEDPTNIIDKIIERAKIDYKSKQEQEKTKKPVKVEPQKTQKAFMDEFQCHGTFLVPPLQIGKVPRISFSKRLFGWPPYIFELGTVHFEDTFNGHNFIATPDGLVAIEAERTVALEMLNTLLAALFLRGTSLYVIREHELGEFQFDKASKKFDFWSIPGTSRLSSFGEQRQQFPLWKKSKLSPDQLNHALRDAELYWNDRQFRFYLPFLLESNTHFAEHDYTQSFFMSWIIIETYLTKKWKTLLHKKKISGNQLKKLKNPGMWSIDYLMEAMNLQGSLPNADYEILMKLKKKRNKLLHGTVKATKDDAQEALSLAINIIENERSRLNKT